MINEYIQFIGLPASGKTTFLKENYSDAINVIQQYTINHMHAGEFFSVDTFKGHLILNAHKYKGKHVIISADEIKPWLFGYTHEHPEVVHEESVQLVKNIIFFLADIEHPFNVILDGGGINNHYNISIIDYIRKANRDTHVTCVFLDTPIDVCIKRLEGRERKVPIEDIYQKNLKLEVCKNRYIDLVDEFIRVDYFTNKYVLLDMDGTLACYGKTKIDIHGNADFVSSELFKNLKPVTHVIEFIKSHCNMDNVYIVTACPNSIAWKEKNEWLDKHFPEIPLQNRMFVGNKHYKHVFIEQLAHKMKWKKHEVTMIDDFHETLDKCTSIGINAVHPSNIEAMFNKYSYQA